ncbi:MAG TPA: transglutaminase family protein [Burkholderiaceae bacterium]
MAGARYQVTHETEYHYESSVVHAWQLVHLEPRATVWQRLLEHSLEVEPQPSEIERSLDYFGNPLRRFLVARPHDVLLVRARSLVEVAARAPASGAVSPPWEIVCDDAAGGPHARRYELAQYLAPSPFAPLLPGAAEFGRRAFEPGRPWLQALQGLARLIHGEFEFDPVATTVSTPVTTLLENRRGVCQDFAHLMVSALRSLGLPARYVSGYILTTPPPGKPRLVGADASHAWVSAWCPGLGWVDADPTNAKLADLEFVTLAWGRDYRDVPPLRGVVRGGDEQRLDVRVTVEPVAPPEHAVRG